MMRMSAKRQNDIAEAVRNAATGYAVVVLCVICFLLVLAIVISGVRIVVGSNLAANTATTAQTTITVNPGENEAA